MGTLRADTSVRRTFGPSEMARSLTGLAAEDEMGLRKSSHLNPLASSSIGLPRDITGGYVRRTRAGGLEGVLASEQASESANDPKNSR